MLYILKLRVGTAPTRIFAVALVSDATSNSSTGSRCAAATTPGLYQAVQPRHGIQAVAGLMEPSFLSLLNEDLLTFLCLYLLSETSADRVVGLKRSRGD